MGINPAPIRPLSSIIHSCYHLRLNLNTRASTNRSTPIQLLGSTVVLALGVSIDVLRCRVVGLALLQTALLVTGNGTAASVQILGSAVVGLAFFQSTFLVPGNGTATPVQILGSTVVGLALFQTALLVTGNGTAASVQILGSAVVGLAFLQTTLFITGNGTTAPIQVLGSTVVGLTFLDGLGGFRADALGGNVVSLSLIESASISPSCQRHTVFVLGSIRRRLTWRQSQSESGPG